MGPPGGEDPSNEVLSLFVRRANTDQQVHLLQVVGTLSEDGKSFVCYTEAQLQEMRVALPEGDFSELRAAARVIDCPQPTAADGSGRVEILTSYGDRYFWEFNAHALQAMTRTLRTPVPLPYHVDGATQIGVVHCGEASLVVVSLGDSAVARRWWDKAMDDELLMSGPLTAQLVAARRDNASFTFLLPHAP